MKKAAATQKAPRAIGPYSQAIISDSRKLVFVSGQLPLEPGTSTMANDIAGQTERSILNLEAILKEAGSSLADVVKTTVFLTDMADFAKMNTAYAEFFTEPYPARSTVAVAGLPKAASVEIEVVAVRP